MKANFKLTDVYLYGLHTVNAALKNISRQHKCLYVLDDLALEYASYKPILKVVDKSHIAKMLPEGSVHQGIVLHTTHLPDVHLQTLPLSKETCILLAFDQVTDPHNVGAILRSAACFNVDGVIHTHRNCPPETGTLAKAACGALDHIPFAKVTNLSRTLDELKKEGFWVIGLSEKGESMLSDIELPNKIVLVIGAEGSGMRRLVMETCDFLAKLPTNPVFPTLNASNAAAVALYEIQQQLGMKECL